MGYQAGTLDQRIEVQQKIVTRDAFGAEQVSWSAPRAMWAAKHPLRGKEYMTADHLRANVECKFVVRYLSAQDVTADWRILHGGVVHGIQSVIHVRSAREFIEIMATAGIAQS
jgi:SPP1 family predicted phage head-tail adaptor